MPHAGDKYCIAFRGKTKRFCDCIAPVGDFSCFYCAASYAFYTIVNHFTNCCRIFIVAFFVGQKNTISKARSDFAHNRALFFIAVARRAENEQHAVFCDCFDSSEDFLKSVWRMRIINDHIIRRVSVDALKSPRHAFEIRGALNNVLQRYAKQIRGTHRSSHVVYIKFARQICGQLQFSLMVNCDGRLCSLAVQFYAVNMRFGIGMFAVSNFLSLRGEFVKILKPFVVAVQDNIFWILRKQAAFYLGVCIHSFVVI